jgi:L-asparaginase II
MAAMTKAPPVVARVYRGPRVESSHRGSVAIVDERGVFVDGCGDSAAPVYTRSAAKPFQAMPLLEAGGLRAFRLSDEEIALMCASHGGQPRHVQTAERILRKGGFRAASLECGAHAPMHEASARALLRAGASPTALHNNCSGKHAGMLLACRLLGLPEAGYVDPGHPLQRMIRRIFARYAGLAEAEIAVAVDGCSLPVLRVPLAALACAYARLLAARVPGEDRPAAAARARIVRAMTKRPFMVAGSGRFTTHFLAAGRGRWIGKEGAEGVYAIGLPASAASRHAVGVAFKIEDGSARPRDAVTLDVLARLGRLPLEARRALATYAEPRVYNARGLEVGRIEAETPIGGARHAAAGRRAAGTG